MRSVIPVHTLSSPWNPNVSSSCYVDFGVSTRVPPCWPRMLKREKEASPGATPAEVEESRTQPDTGSTPEPRDASGQRTDYCGLQAEFCCAGSCIAVQEHKAQKSESRQASQSSQVCSGTVRHLEPHYAHAVPGNPRGRACASRARHSVSKQGS